MGDSHLHSSASVPKPSFQDLYFRDCRNGVCPNYLWTIYIHGGPGFTFNSPFCGKGENRLRIANPTQRRTSGSLLPTPVLWGSGQKRCHLLGKDSWTQLLKLNGFNNCILFSCLWSVSMLCPLSATIRHLDGSTPGICRVVENPPYSNLLVHSCNYLTESAMGPSAHLSCFGHHGKLRIP